MACAYLQSFDDWYMRITDDKNGCLDLEWLLKQTRHILGKSINEDRIEYNIIQSPKKSDALCARRDLMKKQAFHFSDCETIVTFDDDDIYLPNYIQKTVDYFNINHECLAIISSDVWRYNLYTQEYIDVKNYSGGCQWSMKKELFRQYPYICYCHQHCINGGKMRHVAGACRDACIYQQIIDARPKLQIGKAEFNESIRTLHPDNTRPDRSWLNDVSRFGVKKDVDFVWLKEKLPNCLHNYYFTEIV
jgi:hypothetical protein